MSQNFSNSPQEVLNEILSALQNNEPEARLEAMRRLREIDFSSAAICNALERVALRDPDEEVRAEALRALDFAAQKHVRAKLNKMERGFRLALLREIDEWENDGLLEKENAAVLRKRYDFDLTPAASKESAREIEPKAEPAPKIQPEARPEPQTASPTLTQTLLSETSVKIALYLGAFFVVSAAVIFAALVEMARLPILLVGTLLFGGAAAALKKRLPQPSFALFVVFSFLLPISANVLEESLNFSPPFNAAYWTFVSAFMALLWAGGSWMYESKLFSVVAFLSLSVSFFRAGDMFHAPNEFSVLMLGIAALTGLLGTWALKQWRDSKFALPLFFAAQVLQAGVLAASLTLYFMSLMDVTNAPLWNLAHVFVWGFACAFYVFSNNLYSFPLFPWFAAGALMGIPFFFAAAFEMGEPGGALTLSVWASLLAAASEAAHWLKRLAYYLPVLLAAVLTSVFGIIAAFAYNETTAFFTLLWFAFAFAALHFLRPRGWVWALALLDFIAAYFTFFALPFMEGAEIFFGYKLLGLSVLLLAPDLFAEKEGAQAWRLPPRLYGAALAVFAFLFYVFTQEEVSRATVMFGGFAAFFLLFNLTYRKPIRLYALTASLSVFVIFLLKNFDLVRWIHPLTVLAVGYYGLGFFLRKLNLAPGWETPLLWSGFAAGVIASFASPAFEGLDAALPPALAATLFAVEAFARKDARLGFPANGLYLLSYFLLLIHLDVNQPQFYSVGAAALGMIQHYFLVRAESKTGAFLMGMASQLVLLGATYVQMASSEDLAFFFLLFLQALAVITYGVVIRSRSLVFTPIGFLALGLFTVLYSALKGLGAVILVGCSGVLLIGLGILAVILREKISNLGGKFSDWKA